MVLADHAQRKGCRGASIYGRLPDLRHKPPLTGSWIDGSDPIATASIDGAVVLLDEDMLDED
jgi:hypothetical protein